MAAEPPACTLCGAQRYRHLFEEVLVSGRVFSLARCLGCGLVRTLPVPDAAFLDALYAAEHHRERTATKDYCSDEQVSGADHAPVLQRLAALAQGERRLLDVGCGRGLFVRRALEEGWDAHGIEPSPYAGGLAADALGARVKVGHLEGETYPASSFDVVTFWYVLEHVPDPGQLLEAACALLRLGGLVFVAVPNWRYIRMRRQLARVTTGRPGTVHAHEHLHQFTQPTLRALFERVGLQVAAESFASPFLLSGHTGRNVAKRAALGGVRALFALTGINLSGILMYGRKCQVGS